MTTTIMPIGEEIAGWERALYAYPAEKERRNGSRRTVEGYSCMLRLPGRLDKRLHNAILGLLVAHLQDSPPCVDPVNGEVVRYGVVSWFAL